MSRGCSPGAILVGWQLLGRFTAVQCFLLLWFIALAVVNAILTLYRLVDVRKFVLNPFLMF